MVGAGVVVTVLAAGEKAGKESSHLPSPSDPQLQAGLGPLDHISWASRLRGKYKPRASMGKRAGCLALPQTLYSHIQTPLSALHRAVRL